MKFYRWLPLNDYTTNSAPIPFNGKPIAKTKHIGHNFPKAISKLIAE
jgi:hypothetical protein